MNEEKILLQKEEAEENVLFGVIGAFLFSLVGGVLYYVLYQIGYLAAHSHDIHFVSSYNCSQ